MFINMHLAIKKKKKEKREEKKRKGIMVEGEHRGRMKEGRT